MIAKMLIKSTVAAGLAAFAWNTPAVQSVAQDVQSISHGVSSFTALASSPFSLGSQESTVHREVGRCEVDLVVDTQDAPKGSIADLRAAAATMSTLTGMNISVTRGQVENLEDYAAAHEYTKIPVRFVSSNEITERNAGQVPYAITSGAHAGDKQLTEYILVNKDMYSQLGSGTGANTGYTVMLHELGHVAGLRHNADGSSLMAEVPVDSQVTDQDRTDLLDATAACR